MALALEITMLLDFALYKMCRVGLAMTPHHLWGGSVLGSVGMSITKNYGSQSVIEGRRGEERQECRREKRRREKEKWMEREKEVGRKKRQERRIGKMVNRRKGRKGRRKNEYT